MTEEAARNSSAIEELLATRQRISEWLHRLGQAGGGVPANVRDRVRVDYQGRLARVVEDLRGHSAAINDTLSGLRRELAERERVQAAEEETLAEAQLRHAVGEYTDQEWQGHEERAGSSLEALGGEIHRLGSEIVRLEDVLAQIAGSPAAAAEPPVADIEFATEEVGVGESADGFAIEPEGFITIDDAPVDPRTQSVFDAPVSAFPTDPDPAMEPIPVEPVTPEAPKFTPRSGMVPARPRSAPVSAQAPRAVEDEMAFLQSVTAAPGVAGRSGNSESRIAAGTAVATKTLKCQDCGTLNRPTEWYCERCGAELSAV